MFPGVALSVIRGVLREEGGNHERTISRLLDLEDEKVFTVTPLTKSPSLPSAKGERRSSVSPAPVKGEKMWPTLVLDDVPPPEKRAGPARGSSDPILLASIDLSKSSPPRAPAKASPLTTLSSSSPSTSYAAALEQLRLKDAEDRLRKAEEEKVELKRKLEEMEKTQQQQKQQHQQHQQQLQQHKQQQQQLQQQIQKQQQQQQEELARAKQAHMKGDHMHEEVRYPAYWEPILTQQDKLTLYSVPVNSPEFVSVAER